MGQFSKVEINNSSRGFIEESALVELTLESSLFGFIRTLTLFLDNGSTNKPSIQTGTHTGSNNSTTTLTDSAADFIRNTVQPGDIVTNTTDANAQWEVVSVDSATQLTVQLHTSAGGDDDFDTSDTYLVNKRLLEELYVAYKTDIKLTSRLNNKVLFRGIVQEALPSDNQGRFMKIIAVSHEAELRDGSPDTSNSGDARSAVLQDAINDIEGNTNQFLFPLLSSSEATPGIEHSPNSKTVAPDFASATRGALAAFIDMAKTEPWCHEDLLTPVIPAVAATVDDEAQELTISANGNLAQSFTVSSMTLVSKIMCHLGTTGTPPSGNLYVRIETNDEDGDSVALDVPSKELVTSWAESNLVNITNITTAAGTDIFFVFDEPVALRDNVTYWIVLAYQEDNNSGISAGVNFVQWQDDSAAGYANGTMALYTGTTWAASAGKDFHFSIYDFEYGWWFYDKSGDAWEYQTTAVEVEDVTRTHFMGTLAGAGSTGDRLYMRAPAPFKGIDLLVENQVANSEYGTITAKYFAGVGAKITGEHTGSDNQATVLSDSDKEFRLSAVAVGDVLWNLPDDSYGIVTVIAKNDLTVGDLRNGSGNDWDKGDTYAVINLELVQTGTETAGGTTTMTDSGATFDVQGVREGDLLINVTDNLVDVITAYTGTTITTGSSLTWTIGDTYKIVSRWRALTIKGLDEVTFLATGIVKLEWEIPGDWVPTFIEAGSPEASGPSGGSFVTINDYRGYFISIQSTTSPGTLAQVDKVTIVPGAGYSLLVLDETRADVIIATGGTHDGSANASALTDTSEDFINTHGVLIGDIVDNITDGSSGTITGFSTDTNKFDTIAATLSGGTDNDWDSSDKWRIKRNRFKIVYFRNGSKPFGRPSVYGQTLRDGAVPSNQTTAILSSKFSESTRSTVNRVRVVGRTSGGAVVDQVVNNITSQREDKRISTKAVVDYSIRSTGEADDRGNAELARLVSRSRRAHITTLKLPMYTKTFERQNWFASGTNLLHKLDGTGSAVTVYEHDGGNDSASLIDTSVNFNKWGIEIGDLVTNSTDGSTMAVTGISTTTNEGDTLTGTLTGGTGNEWDNTDEYKVQRRKHVDVGDLIRVKVNDPGYIDKDYLVVGLIYHEPSFACTMRVSENLIAPSVGDQQTTGEVLQNIQDDARRALQIASY